MKKQIVMLGIVVLLICVGLSGCTSQDTEQDTDIDISDKTPQELILGTWKMSFS